MACYISTQQIRVSSFLRLSGRKSLYEQVESNCSVDNNIYQIVFFLTILLRRLNLIISCFKNNKKSCSEINDTFMKFSCTVCPSNCNKCSQTNGVITCNAGQCNIGYAVATDGSYQANVAVLLIKCCIKQIHQRINDCMKLLYAILILAACVSLTSIANYDVLP